jgi:hypothetical protein
MGVEAHLARSTLPRAHELDDLLTQQLAQYPESDRPESERAEGTAVKQSSACPGKPAGKERAVRVASPYGLP